MIRVPRSLGGRLLLGASAFILLALVLTGAAMDFALRRFIQGQVDGRLDGQVMAVADALRRGPDGALRLEHGVDGPPFERPLSGWYWQVLAPGPVLRSASLPPAATFTVAPPPPGDGPHPVERRGSGPAGEPLRVRAFRVEAGPEGVTVAAAAPLEALAGPLREAMTPLVATLALLAAGLIGAVLLQVRLGLRPLALLRAELAAVRTGAAERIDGPQPREIAPLVAELNTLLDQHAANLERARRHVANLGHGLKTPLATLTLALGEPGMDPQNRLRPLVVTMDRRIRHHLSRARAAALGGAARSRTALAPAVADHVGVFARLYADKAIAFTVAVAPELMVACDAQDLDEMLGNLLDNACKWTRGTVRVAAAGAGKALVVTVADDGPGLTDGEAADVLRPGTRIDESRPGYGFGLPITRELAELYGGSLAISRDGSGGLAATLTLPAA